MAKKIILAFCLFWQVIWTLDLVTALLQSDVGPSDTREGITGALGSRTGDELIYQFVLCTIVSVVFGTVLIKTLGKSKPAKTTGDDAG